MDLSLDESRTILVDTFSEMLAKECSAGHVLLARTSTQDRPHRGLTMFIVPTDAEGGDIQAIHTMGGERANAVYLSNVRLPDAYRIGEVDQGWAVVRFALSLEQAMGYAAARAVRRGCGPLGAGAGAAAGGRFSGDFLETPIDTIYGGSAEILRSLVAEVELGLPKSR